MRQHMQEGRPHRETDNIVSPLGIGLLEEDPLEGKESESGHEERPKASGARPTRQNGNSCLSHKGQVPFEKDCKAACSCPPLSSSLIGPMLWMLRTGRPCFNRGS